MAAQRFEIAGVPYMVVTPVKSLFRSTLIHDVVNRGDKFVVNLETGTLTVMDVSFLAAEKVMPAPAPAPVSKELVRLEREKLKVLQAEAAAREEQRASLNAMFDRMAKVFEGGGL